MGKCAAAVGVVHIDVARLNDQAAAVRHRVAGVDGTVHQHLLELTGVANDRPQGGVQPRVDRDVFADGAREHTKDVGHHLVEIEGGGMQHLLPAEGQQLPREPCRAIRRSPDLEQLAVYRLVPADLIENQVAVADDGREHVVEVVGDAARESADGLHLLGLPELVFQPFPCGDVFNEHLELVRPR